MEVAELDDTFQSPSRWERALYGRRYATAVLIRNVPPIVAGLLLGSIPTALIVNYLGQAIVETPRHDGTNHTWDETMSFYGWTKEDNDLVSPAAFWTFTAWRLVVLALTLHVSLYAVLDGWRGMDKLMELPHYLLLLRTKDLMMLAYLFVQPYLLFTSKLPGFDNPVVIHVTEIPTYLLWASLTGLTFALSCPAGRGKQTVLPTLVIIFTLMFAYWAVGWLLQQYFAEQNSLVRSLILFTNSTILRAVTFECVVMASRWLPDTTSEITGFLVAANCTMISAANFFLQSSAQSFWSSLLSNFVITLSTLLRNLALLNGTNEVVICWRALVGSVARLHRACCGSSEAELSRSSSSAKILEEDDPVYIQVVEVTEDMELTMIFLVAGLFMLAKLNPEDVNGQPLPPLVVLERFAVNFACQRLCQFLTVFFASKSNPEVAAAKGSSLNGRYTRRMAKMVGLMHIVTGMNFFTRTISLMCPAPDAPAGGRLRAIGACP